MSSKTYSSEAWGKIAWPEDKDMPLESDNRPGSKPLGEAGMEGLEDFWKEVLALGNPDSYASIGRIYGQENDFADTVVLYFPGGRMECYEVKDSFDRTEDKIEDVSRELNSRENFVDYFEEEIGSNDKRLYLIEERLEEVKGEKESLEQERERFERNPEEYDGKVRLSIMGEEGSQHGFMTCTMRYRELTRYTQKLISKEDDLHWREWDGDI